MADVGGFGFGGGTPAAAAGGAASGFPCRVRWLISPAGQSPMPHRRLGALLLARSMRRWRPLWRGWLPRRLRSWSVLVAVARGLLPLVGGGAPRDVMKAYLVARIIVLPKQARGSAVRLWGGAPVLEQSCGRLCCARWPLNSRHVPLAARLHISWPESS